MRAHLLATAEYDRRVEAARQLMRTAHLDGLLLWSRGGGSMERHGHVLYFTGFYCAFPTIPDVPGAWADRGYTAALITADAVVLFADVENALAEGVVANEAVSGTDLVAAVAAALKRHQLSAGTLGLAGTDTMTQRQAARLAHLCPDLVLVPADELVMQVRRIKSAAEIALLRRAAQVGAGALAQVIASVVAGAREADIAAGVARTVAHAGGVVLNTFIETFPAARDARTQRDVEEAVLAPGQLFTIDISGAVEGYYFDHAWSGVVDVAPMPEQQRLLELTKASVNAVVDALRPGATIGAATRAGLHVLAKAGYDTARDEFQALGHGLGLGFEPPWLRPDDTTPVDVGMCLAIEKFCVAGEIGATFERSVVVTPDGAEDLAAVPEGW